MAVVNTHHPIITLTTDFGEQDNYVGVVKGVILALNPNAGIVDVSHAVPPFNVAAARYILETAIRAFPPGSIHVAVVDPGVGTSRDAVLIDTGEYFFIGPDNGLFSFLPKKEIRKIISISKRKYLPKDISATFHARDVFAHVAAFLSLGVVPDEFGPVKKNLVSLPCAEMKRQNGDFLGTVIYIDHFGNLVTSIRRENLPGHEFLVFIDDHQLGPLRKTFASVPVGKPVCYVNSFGFIEIAVREGSAADYFHINYDSAAKILIAPL